LDDKTLKLKRIVPEYNSKNVFVKKLFWDRLNTAITLSKATKNQKIVDIGAGPGSLINLLLKKGIHSDNIYALDFNKNIISLKKKYKKVHFQIADLQKTDYPSSQFDIVFCLDVLEHIKNINPAINEIKRIAKDGAMLIVSIPKENFFYKLGRFLIKGTFSMESGPGPGKHYYNSWKLINILSNNFHLVRMKKLRVLGVFNLFTIYAFKILKS